MTKSEFEQFQSLLCWNTSIECVAVAFGNPLTMFQSLLCWNTSIEPDRRV